VYSTCDKNTKTFLITKIKLLAMPSQSSPPILVMDVEANPRTLAFCPFEELHRNILAGTVLWKQVTTTMFLKELAT